MEQTRLEDLILAQEQVEALTRDSIRAIQLRKLNRLLRREKQRQGFYRDLPEKLERLEDLARLPFTTEEDLASRGPGLLLCSQAEIQRVLSDATSGTTGRAKRVFYTRGDCENTVRFFMAGLGELVFPGSVTAICFPFSGPYGLGELIAEAIQRLGARPLKLGPGLSYGQWEQLMQEQQPDTYVGMPHQLLSLLRCCGRGSLRRALVSGDVCPPAVARCCEEILGSPLFPHYGSREMCLGGAVCCPAHEGMHLRENHVIAEVLDDRQAPVAPGETGELVITTIGMEAMPLIRYRTGDLVRRLPTPCPCGSELMRLAPLRRLGDDGSLARLDEALLPLAWVADYVARREAQGMHIQLLRCGPGPLPSLDGVIDERWVRREDRCLSPGKRRILGPEEPLPW